MILASIKDWFDWVPSDALIISLKWFVVGVLIVVGFLGTFLPILPQVRYVWFFYIDYIFLFYTFRTYHMCYMVQLLLFYQ